MASSTASHYRTSGGDRRNVGTADRVVSGLLGAWMITGRRRRRQGFGKVVAVASGVLLLRRAATAHSAVYERLGVSSADLGEGAGINIEQAVTINRPIHEVYEFMHDLTNLPIIFTHIAEVTVGPGDLSHWTLKAAPGSRAVSWDVRVLNDVPNEYISWMSVDGSSVQQSGSMHFTKAPADRGTEVHVKLRYRPPGGAWGFGVAKLLNGLTASGVGADLRRLKQLLETGSVATTEGQPTGPSPAELRDAEREQREARQSKSVPAHRGGAPLPTKTPTARLGEPMYPLKEPEPVVTRGFELDPAASRKIEGAPVPEVELERVLAGVEGVDALRPVAVEDEYRSGDDL